MISKITYFEVPNEDLRERAFGDKTYLTQAEL